MDLIHKKMDKVRTRQSSAIERFLVEVFPRLENKELLQILSSEVKMVVSQPKAQTYCNKTIRARFRDEGVISESENSFLSYVYTPLSLKLKKDINTYREAKENRQVLKFFESHSVLKSINPGEYASIVGVDRRNDNLDLLLESGDTVKWEGVSTSQNDQDYSFAVYEEVNISLSIGDIVRIRENIPGSLLVDGQILKVESIDKTIITLTDINGNIHKLNSTQSTNRHFEYEYCSILFEKQSDLYDVTIGCFEKELDDSATIQIFESLKSKSVECMYAFSFDPPLRKSVQLACPSDIYSSFKSLVADKKSDLKTYMEMLIDKFLSGKGQRFSDPSNNYWFMLYSSPGDSKPYACWVSSSHYDAIAEYCEKKDLRINRLIFTLVILELVNEGRLTVN